jgi:hypothetical protein
MEIIHSPILQGISGLRFGVNIEEFDVAKRMVVYKQTP